MLAVSLAAKVCVTCWRRSNDLTDYDLDIMGPQNAHNLKALVYVQLSMYEEDILSDISKSTFEITHERASDTLKGVYFI